MKAGSDASIFVTTTPMAIPFPAPAAYLNTSLDGITLECIAKRNAIANQVAIDVGGVEIAELHAYVTDFCDRGPRAPAGSPFAGNFFNCSLQTLYPAAWDGNETTTGEHFFTRPPMPSGQQYTALSVAQAVIRRIPPALISNRSAASAPPPALPPTHACTKPAVLSKVLPNVMLALSSMGAATASSVRRVLQSPHAATLGPPGPTGALAHVQDAGEAGSSAAGARCISTWLGAAERWDSVVLGFGLADCTAPSPTEPAVFAANVKAMVAAATARLARNGSVVWVGSVPAAANDTVANACVARLNAAATAVLDNFPGVVVTDLHAAVTAMNGSLQVQDSAQLSSAGAAFVAVEIAHTVAPLLGGKWAALREELTMGPPPLAPSPPPSPADGTTFVGLEECGANQEWAPLSTGSGLIQRKSGGCVATVCEQRTLHPPAPWSGSCSLAVVACNASDVFQHFTFNRSSGLIHGHAQPASTANGNDLSQPQCVVINQNSRAAGAWADMWKGCHGTDATSFEQVAGGSIRLKDTPTMCLVAGVKIAGPPAPPPPAPDPAPGLRTIGTYDLSGGETTPFVWHGSLLLVESVGYNSVLPFTKPVYGNCTEYATAGSPWNDTRCPYFRIRKMKFDSGYTTVADTVVTAYVPGSADMSFCNAIMRNETGVATLWVFGTNNDQRWGGAPRSQVHAFWTTDLVTWNHSVALDIAAFNSSMSGAYNVDVTSRPDGTSVMALEPSGSCSGGVQCLSYFAECSACGSDLSRGWKLLDGTKYTAAAMGEVDNPTIRYMPGDGYYYLVTARAHTVTAVAPPLLPTRWTTMIGRSKDLITWEESPHLWGFACQPADLSIIPGSALDKLGDEEACMPFCNKSFAQEPVIDINRSDMDFWELPAEAAGGEPKTFVVWVTGNQGTGAGTLHSCPHDCGASAAGIVDSSLEKWLQSYFPIDQAGELELTDNGAALKSDDSSASRMRPLVQPAWAAGWQTAARTPSPTRAGRGLCSPSCAPCTWTPTTGSQRLDDDASLPVPAATSGELRAR